MYKELDIAGIELYQEPSGEMLVRPLNKPLFVLDEEKREFIVPMKIMISSDFPDAWKACQEWNRKSRHNTTYFDYVCVKRFCKCNFQKYDNQLDVDENGAMHFEFTDCPLRGDCQYENVICNPKFSTRLTKSDLQILKMIVVQQMTSDQISLVLGRSVNTINNRRKIIQKKTGCNTIPKLVAYWYENNLR
ncbi:MAG: hypothetical protein RSH25_10665 [Bacteroides sp.]|uniref:helix-turn-helix transcriptional regulator n=1 Tax=Bacteroides sp. TaxID=29523 RepID=UPI002FC5CB4D